ncbi:GNAT family N-acetyltransferase [Mycoplasmatota bacterium]|nr:GNAT family N-acetyltransferase [Mycoplasmatota bacterium]
MNYRIREANLSDYNQINQLAVQLYQLHFKNRSDIFNDTEMCFTHENFKMDLFDENSKIIVCEVNDTIIGYTFFKYITQKKSLLCKERHLISIYDFVVDKNYRNLGIGKIIHQKIVDFANEKKCHIIELDVWFFNQNAIHFYDKLGYLKKNMKMELYI